MARKVKVPIWRSPGGIATVDDGATVGAQAGVNLFDENGELVTSLSGLNQSSGSAASSSGSSGSARTGVITPTQLTADTDDWDAGITSTTRRVRFSTDASRTINSMLGGADGVQLTLVNIGANDGVLGHDTSGTAANRFLCPGSASMTINPNDSVEVWYDATSERWRAIGV